MLAVTQQTADGVRNQPRKLDPLIFSDRSYALLKYVSRVACLLCTWPPVIHTCCDTCYRHCHTRTLKYVDVRFPDLWLVNFTKCSILTGRNWHICEPYLTSREHFIREHVWILSLQFLRGTLMICSYLDNRVNYRIQWMECLDWIYVQLPS